MPGRANASASEAPVASGRTRPGKLSVVIPAHDEEACIESTVQDLAHELARAGIAHEILVVDDHSTDRTRETLAALAARLPELRILENAHAPGFGFAVRTGLERFTGDAVAVVMADASDRPADLVRFFRALEETGADCVFGTRWSRGSRVADYPLTKRVVNRLVNQAIRLLFGFRYNDATNAFKLYRRHVIEGLQPLLSHHFNLTVELPLKAIVRGYRYAVVPNDWVGRRGGQSKLRLKEMGSRYLFIVLYCLIEKWLSAGDYRRRSASPGAPDAAAAPGSRAEPGSPLSPQRLTGAVGGPYAAGAMPAYLEIRVGEPVELDAELPSGRLRVRVRRREVGDDGGVSIELSGAARGEPAELLRFDLFRRDPHYHVPASDPAQIDLDVSRDGDPLEFMLACIRERLPELLDRAKCPQLARSVEVTAASALANLASRVRAAVKSAPEPSSSYRIELDRAPAEPPPRA